MRRRALAAGAVVAIAAVCVGLFFVTRSGGQGTTARATTTTTTERPAATGQGATQEASLAELVLAAGLGDPMTISIPAPGGDAKAWLEGDGAPAAELVETTQILWRSGAGECESVVVALDGLGTPDAVAAATAGTPDGPTQEILLGLQTATESALRACGDPGAFESARAELAWQWAIADRRLNEIGVDR